MEDFLVFISGIITFFFFCSLTINRLCSCHLTPHWLLKNQCGVPHWKNNFRKNNYPPPILLNIHFSSGLNLAGEVKKKLVVFRLLLHPQCVSVIFSDPERVPPILKWKALPWQILFTVHNFQFHIWDGWDRRSVHCQAHIRNWENQHFILLCHYVWKWKFRIGRRLFSVTI